MNRIKMLSLVITIFAFSCKSETVKLPRMGVTPQGLDVNPPSTEYVQQSEKEQDDPIIKVDDPINNPPAGLDPSTPSALRTCYKAAPVGTIYNLETTNSSVFSPCANSKTLTPTSQVAGDNLISGRAWFDDNMNGIEDPGETAAQGVTFYIDANNNCILDSNEITFRAGQITNRSSQTFNSGIFFSTIGFVKSINNGVPNITPIPNGNVSIRIVDSLSNSLLQYFFHSTDGTNSFKANFSNGTRFENLSFPIIRPRDYGDAPASYGTANTYQEFSAKYYLGSSIGLEKDAAMSADAEKDDKLICAGEDGVTFPANMKYGTTQYINVTAGFFGGILNAWIDYDHNGKFDADERAIDFYSLSPGPNQISISIPANSKGGPPLTTYARFRLNATGIYNAGAGTSYYDVQATGNVPMGGEIEDYKIVIE